MISQHTYTALGDRAVLIEVKSGVSEEDDSMSAAALARKIKAYKLKGITDIVPAFSRIAIHYDPNMWVSSSLSPFETIVQYLEKNLVTEDPILIATKPQLIRIPVCYDLKMGLDLSDISLTLGVSIDDVINLHQSAVYTVGAIGFAPGFAYLEGLDPALKIPRRDAPRTRVPSGSVAIAAGYSGIYPSTLPGGWHILGRTRRSFFQKEGDFGSLLSVGDQVKFEIISVEAYEAIESDF